MNFTPAPPNQFREFVQFYHDRCRDRCPQILAAAGKWEFEDLVPGLSDFDTRFVFADTMTIADWGRASVAVGEVHTELARERPDWARILEHLPGANPTLSELTNPVLYAPESLQWTFYVGEEAVLAPIRQSLENTRWSERDEFHHLKRFAGFRGPYQRGIDPPVNLGAWENKYALHSRFFHYFTPAVQCAVSLYERKPCRGKLAALRAARNIFPHPGAVDMALEALDRHYEVPEWYEDPRLGRIEAVLQSYLDEAYRVVTPRLTLIDGRGDPSPETLQEQLRTVRGDPLLAFCEGVKFSRLMKGRLLFYATPIPWFESGFLIANELGRMVRNFFVLPFTAFGEVIWGEKRPPASVLESLRGDILPGEVCDGVIRFVEAAGAAGPADRSRAMQVAGRFEPMQHALETLGAKLLACVPAEPVESHAR